MPNTASRLSANGSLTISGSFDEVSGTYVTSGLVGSWDVNKSYYLETNASTWYDMAGNNNIRIFNNNGTPALFSPSSNSANITFFTTNGTSVSLGSYGVVTIPQLATTANVTIEGVINIRQFNGGMIAGFHRYDIWTLGGGLGFNTFNSDLYGISAATVTSLNLLNRNVHYVFVMPTSNLPGAYQLWINGVQQSLSALSGTSSPSRTYNLYDNTYTFQLNGHYAGTPVNGTIPSIGSYYGNASWSSFRMYNRVLTSAEIQQNFNIASARYRLGSTVNPVVTATRSNNTTQTITQAISGEFDEVTYNPTANVRVNTLSNSQQFNLSPWGTYQATVTANVVVAPDGTTTAFSLNEDTTTGEHLIFQSRTGRDETMTASYYAKAAARTRCYISLSNYVNFSCQVHYDLIAGTITYISGNNSDYTNVSGTITPVGNGWFRCTLTATKGSVNNTNSFTIAPVVGSSSVYLGTGVQAIYIWGAQFEQSASPSIYVRTGTNAIIANTFNQKTTNTGNTYIRATYDEYSKMSPITEGLIFNVDPGYEGSYVGSGAAMYDTTSNRYKVDLLGNSTPKYSSDFGGILKFTSTFGNNEYANTNIPSRTITPTSNYTMSAWVKFNPSIKGLAEFQYYISATGSLVSPQANTGFAYGSAGSILGTTYYGDYGLFWYSQIRTSGEKQLLVGFQNRVTPYAEASPQLAYTMNDSLIFFNWTHIVGVLNNAGNFAGFYVNGVLVNSTTASQIASGSFPYAFPTIRICADNVAGGSAIPRNFDGDIGPMSIWNRALSASEIQQMYTSQRSRFGV